MNERSLFDAALAIADPTEREQFLAEQCASDPKMLARIKGLLSSHDVAGSFLEVPAVPTGALADRTTDFDAAEDDDDSSDGPDLSFLEPSDKPGSLGRLGHYEIVQFLGQGAFGIVLKAFDEKLHRHVAIKTLDPRLARTSAPRKRFLREARAAASVKHDNVVQLYSVEELPIPYLVMEFVEGQTLQSKLDANGPLELGEVLYLGQQMASGLAAAHAQGLIHRDIKPANILIENGVEKKVKITDFGLARTVDDATMTRTGLIVGTPMFMAPEQALGQSVDHRTDLFSVGSVLYQMVTGRPPFRAPTALAVLKRVTDETPRPIRDVISETPTWFCAVVERLHAKRPEDRIQSATELTELLRGQAAALHSGDLNEPIPVAQYVHPAGSPEAFRNPSPFVGPEKQPPSRTRSRWKTIVPAAIAALVLLVVLLLNYPALKLMAANKGRFTNRTQDGVTHIKFSQNNQVVDELYGWGALELPAGWYDVSTSHPNPRLEMWNVLYTTRGWFGVSSMTRLNEIPRRIHLNAGDRIEIAASYVEHPEGWINPDFPMETRAVKAEEPRPPGNAFSAFQWPAGSPAPAIAPFDEDAAEKHQEAWADYLGVPDEWTDGDGVKFVLIPPGEFLMGNPKNEIEKLKLDLKQAKAGAYDQFVAHSSSVQRKVRITKPFYMSACEITAGQYRKFIEESKYLTTKEQLGTNRFNWQDSATGENAEQRAVIGVSWDDALAYCQWKGKRDGGAGSLPTEAQWEYACRAGTTTLWSFGDDVGQLSEYAVFQRAGFWPPEVVGTKKPNPFELFDMHGNADEWCLDWHQQLDPDVPEVTDPAMLDVPVDPSSGRATRGGAAVSVPWWTRSATRAYDSPANPNNPRGFRVVITGDLKKVVEKK
jgi:serine/threonine protein kinase/formylglycine-generating enzyme required for sulfatase activity